MINKEVSSFIIDNLKDIHTSLKCVSLKYEYDKYSMMHIVEVMPLEKNKKKESYINWEINLTNQLAEKYPTEEILFVSEDSLTKVNSPIYTLLPKLVKNYNLSKESVIDDFKIKSGASSTEDSIIKGIGSIFSNDFYLECNYSLAS